MRFDWKGHLSPPPIRPEGGHSFLSGSPTIVVLLLLALLVALPGGSGAHAPSSPSQPSAERPPAGVVSTVPPAGGAQGLAYDYTDHYLLLFDGATTPTQTWAYQGGHWRQLDVGGTSPSARGLVQGQMVWDPFDGYVLLWGGSGAPADTWAWKGDAWTQVCPSCAPSLQQSVTVADPTDGEMLSIAGQQQSGFSDTDSVFAYHASTWTPLPKDPFGSRQTVGAAWDPTSGNVVTFSGYNYTSGGVCFGADADCRDTWSYVSGTWTELCTGGAAPPVCSPEPAARHAVLSAWDPSLNGMVVLGGYNQSTGTPLADTWLWTAGSWQDLTPSSGSPPAVFNAPLACDDSPQDHALIFYGGNSVGGEQTWMFRNGTWSLPYVLSGTVTNASTGAPLQGVNVTDGSNWDLTDAAGRYNLTEENGSVTLRAITAGYQPARVTLAVAGSDLVQDFALTAPLRAYASGSPTSGNAPLTVAFTGGGGGGVSPYTFAWRFGDGGSSLSANPSHTYTTGGVFPARLWVNDSTSRSVSVNVSIVVTSTQALTASASANVTVGYAPLDVQFNGTASGGTPTYTFTWRFGDGTGSLVRNPVHTFPQGTFSVWLWVNDSLGATATSTITVASDPYAPIQVLASVSPSSVPLGATATFSVSASGGSGLYTTIAYAGLPAGCASADQFTLTCTPTALGTFTVNVTVTDNRGNYGYQEVTLVVHAPGPLTLALVASPHGLPLGGASWLNSTPSAGSGIYVRFAWANLPAGCSSANLSDLRCSPATAGHDNVTSTVWDSTGATASATVELDVYSLGLPLSVTLVASPANISLGASATLRAFALGGSGTYTSYVWALPPGCSGSTTSQVDCAPSRAGTFVVSVTVTDSAGHVASSETNLTVSPAGRGPVAQGFVLSSTELVVVLLTAVLAGVAVAWIILMWNSRHRTKGAAGPRGGRILSHPPPPPPASGAPSPAPSTPPSASAPPGYYAGVSWVPPRPEWGEHLESAFGQYTVSPAGSRGGGGSVPEVASPPRTGSAAGGRPWVMDVGPEGIQVNSSSKIGGATSEVRDPSLGEDAEMTAVFEESEEGPVPNTPRYPPVTPDHAYAVLQALDRRPRSMDGIRQLIRLEDYWLLGLVSALVDAKLIASGTNVKTGRTVFALTPVGRKIARRSLGPGAEGAGPPPSLSGRPEGAPTSPTHGSPEGSAPAPLDLAAGTRVTDVQRIGVERMTTEEDNPLEGLRPEDVNPQLKGKKTLPKSVLQPLELRLSKDRGSELRDASERKDADARARELMIAARKAREQKAQRSQSKLQREPRPEEPEAHQK